MKWYEEIVVGILENITQVTYVKIVNIEKREGGYSFDLHIKLITGMRGTCRGMFIGCDFIKDSAVTMSDIFVNIVKKEIAREQLDKSSNKDKIEVKDGR